MTVRLAIASRPPDAASRGRGALALARATRLEVTEARALLEGREGIPTGFEEAVGGALREALESAGFRVESRPGLPTAASTCATHPMLESEGLCEVCRTPVCAVCVLASGRRCRACDRAARRRLGFRNLRVGVLVFVAAALVFGLLLRARALDRRTLWAHPLSVSVVLVAAEPITQELSARWRSDLEGLEGWFSSEWGRYREPSPVPMITFSLDEVATLPELPRLSVAGTGARGVIELELALRRQLHLRGDRDAVIVVALGDGEGEGEVEGLAEAGGTLGLVRGGLHAPDAALELAAVAHELLHCLGALDKYDAAGHALVPQGLAEPDVVPRFPQRFAEVMVGEIPVSLSAGRGITSLGEVAIGPVTAREIKW